MAKKITSKNELTDLSNKLQLLKNEVISLGLVGTYHLLDEASKKIGWEIAETIEGNNILVEIK